MTDEAAPRRKSIAERMAEKRSVTAPLVESSVDSLATTSDTTTTFRVDVTGALVADEFAPVPLQVERTEPHGELDVATGQAYHLVVLPEDVSEDDLEALMVSVWNEAGWLAPGVLRLKESATLEGPWSVSEGAGELGIPEDLPQVWRLVYPPRRGAPPLPEIMEMDAWSRAFPDGMPVGTELEVLQTLHRAVRRLEGALRIAGSGYLMRPDPEVAVNLRVFSDQWLSPAELLELLEPHIPGLLPAQQADGKPGSPYALLAPAARRSQVLVGVREETFLPKALRWEHWAKGTRVYLYDLVWLPPDDFMDLETRPSRMGFLERRMVAATLETAAAALSSVLLQSAVIDEDGFLLALDEPLAEEEQLSEGQQPPDGGPLSGGEPILGGEPLSEGGAPGAGHLAP